MTHFRYHHCLSPISILWNCFFRPGDEHGRSSLLHRPLDSMQRFDFSVAGTSTFVLFIFIFFHFQFFFWIGNLDHFGRRVCHELLLHWIYHNSSCYFHVLFACELGKKNCRRSRRPTTAGRQRSPLVMEGFPGVFLFTLYLSKSLPQSVFLLLMWTDVHNLRREHRVVTVFLSVQHLHERAITTIS